MCPYANECVGTAAGFMAEECCPAPLGNTACSKYSLQLIKDSIASTANLTFVLHLFSFLQKPMKSPLSHAEIKPVIIQLSVLPVMQDLPKRIVAKLSLTAPPAVSVDHNFFFAFYRRLFYRLTCYFFPTATEEAPVVCGNGCEFANSCLAEAAGYMADSCVEVPGETPMVENPGATTQETDAPTEEPEESGAVQTLAFFFGSLAATVVVFLM